MAKKITKLDVSDEMIAERRGGSKQMPKDMPVWMSKTIIGIDLFANNPQWEQFVAKFPGTSAKNDITWT